MVSRKTIKDYGFKSLNEYYNEIVDTHTNGRKVKAADLMIRLSKPQLVYFTDFIKGNEELTALTLQALKR
jgi:hypothetical protein